MSPPNTKIAVFLFVVHALQEATCLLTVPCVAEQVNGTEWMEDPWVPKCENGAWESVQCSLDKEWCWCVNTQGEVEKGSQLQNSESAPDCGGDPDTGVAIFVIIGVMIVVSFAITLFCLVKRSHIQAAHINEVLVDEDSMQSYSPSYVNDSFTAPTIQETPQQPLATNPPTPPIPKIPACFLPSPLVPIAAIASTTPRGVAATTPRGTSLTQTSSSATNQRLIG
eukprot:TRINITY_DN5848_c0_g2_i1.p1 TRINITY_DN5848_c0_g2~~TRINITY_DN5848_c0_g2_i1.p1  ORF type:complete len:224 (+),score=26.43 TRINITY_DN5848_c0_g2_i1:98-769(+)